MANIIFKNIKEGEVLNFNIVLYQPEIPQNTGNIARTCVLTDCKLHLIKPLGFDINEKQVKRAGLDYWSELNLEIHESYEDFLEKYGNETIFLATTHETGTHYDEIEFKSGDFILNPLKEMLKSNNIDCELIEPKLKPWHGAALLAYLLSDNELPENYIELIK